MGKARYLGLAFVIGVVVFALWWGEIQKQEEQLDSEEYHAEYNENERIRQFFDELNRVYGYLHSDESNEFQLFFQVDEALYEGEISGTLLLVEKTGSESNPYRETEYNMNGITDGIMLRLHTIVDGTEVTLEGGFHETADDFELSFWNTDEKLTFQSVTEEEYKKHHEEFIEKTKE